MNFESNPPSVPLDPECTDDCATRSARDFSLAEKLRIVQEAGARGVTFRHVEKKYGLGKNVLAYWRRAYRGLSEAVLVDAVRAGGEPSAAPELAALKLQVERLERLLGQKTLELDLLRQSLEARVRASP
jgi:transposase